MAVPVVDTIFEAYSAGRSAILIEGRSPYDLAVDPYGERLRPLLEILRGEARRRHGMVLVTYSMAGGLDWDSSRIDDERDRRAIEGALRGHRLLDIPQDQNEVSRVIRGIASLCRAPTEGLKWADGQPLRFAFLFEFGEHLAPGTLTNGTQTDGQLIAIELAHLTAQSLALRASGNLVIFSARDGLVDDLVATALHRVRLRQPDAAEKTAFVERALRLYAQATLEAGLTPQSVAHLTTNTPNRGVESVLRASHRTEQPVTSKDLTAEKARSVEELSERTLTLLDTGRVRDLRLCGTNIAVPQALLGRFGEGLARGDSSLPGSALLVGPPGTGKTDLAVHAAATAGVPAFQLNSPKDSLVGGTERKSQLQQRLLAEWTPNLAFADEVTELLPLERSDFDGDSGASRAVAASLLTALSDESRRGRSLFIGTTNCPWRIGAAMRSRFICIPVLHPLERDFPAILVATARRMGSEVEILEDDPRLLEAARLFYQKGANPRHIRSALSNALMRHGRLGADEIVFAARDLCASTDLASAIYADLWALKVTTSRSFLPWFENPAQYPWPEHLQGIVDPSSGDILQAELERKIEELRPHAKV